MDIHGLVRDWQEIKRPSKISWRMRVGRWQFRCQPQRIANFNLRSTGKPVAWKRIARQHTLTLLKTMNLWGRAWKDLLTRIMKIILQEQERIHWDTAIWCTNLFQCLMPWKYQMKKQQWNMGKTRENTDMTANESQKQKWGDRGSEEWGENQTLYVVNGSLSSQDFGVGVTVSKIQRSSRTPRRYCERWFRIVCSIHWAGIIRRLQK